MTEKEKRFAENYIVSLNASDVFLKVSPNCKNPNVYGHQLLSKTEIRKYVDAKIEDIMKKQELKAEDVIAELRKIGFANIGDYLSYNNKGVKFKDSNKVDNSVIKDFSVVSDPSGKIAMKLRMHDKIRALEGLC